jgi:hypothetical protein
MFAMTLRAIILLASRVALFIPPGLPGVHFSAPRSRSSKMQIPCQKRPCRPRSLENGEFPPHRLQKSSRLTGSLRLC